MPHRSGGGDDFQEGSSRGPPPSTQENATPGPERPVCLVRGSLFIEDYIEGKVWRFNILSVTAIQFFALHSAEPCFLWGDRNVK